MSLRRPNDFGFSMGRTALAVLAFMPAFLLSGQYPGQIAKPDKGTPELRSIAVLEWTGDAGKPKASRLVPIAVLDRGELQDGGIYLARPQPLAISGEVEYELEKDGQPMGLFDIKNAGQEQGSWVGYGSWKPMPKARPAPPPQLAKIDDDVQSDVPVLHRKHHPGETPTGGTGAGAGSASGSGSGDSSASQAPPPDPDRPTLHKGGDASGNSTSTGTGTTSSTDSSSDSGQPTLHRHDSSDSSGSGSGNGAASSDDPDRPVLKKNKKQQAADIAHVDSLPDVSDPDRPRLKRGKSEGYALNVIPSLMGIPQDMQQMVAVSDAKSRPEHPWDYTWSNPDDEANMKEALEDIARNALGLNAPPAPPAPAAKKTTASKKSTKPVPPPPPPAELEGEQFRVFELAYGSGATMVLQAHTAGPLAQEKFVTLVAQPDLYGHPMVLLKNITDGAHLDETPRMRLVDAVDAMADNRGELLFELRGATQRQFALYRVLRGQAEKLFVSGGGDFGIERE
jgi:hypothetical protein